METLKGTSGSSAGTTEDLLPIREAYEWKPILRGGGSRSKLDTLLPIREAYEWKPA